MSERPICRFDGRSFDRSFRTTHEADLAMMNAWRDPVDVDGTIICLGQPAKLRTRTSGFRRKASLSRCVVSLRRLRLVDAGVDVGAASRPGCMDTDVRTWFAAYRRGRRRGRPASEWRLVRLKTLADRKQFHDVVIPRCRRTRLRHACLVTASA